MLAPTFGQPAFSNQHTLDLSYNIQQIDLLSKAGIQTISTIYEDTKGILWLIGSEEKAVAFNIKVTSNLYRFDGHHFTKYPLPVDIAKGAFNLISLKEVDDHTFFVYPNNIRKSYLFDTNNQTYREVLDELGMTMGVGDVKKYDDTLYFSSLCGDNFCFYRLEGYVPYKIFETDVEGGIYHMPFVKAKNHLLISIVNNRPCSYKVNMKGKLLKKYCKEDFKHLDPSLSSFNFVNSANYDNINYLAVRSTPVGPIIYTGTNPPFKDLALNQNLGILGWVNVDQYGNLCNLTDYSKEQNLIKILLPNHELFVLDTIQEHIPKPRLLDSRNYAKYIWLSDFVSLYKVNYTPKFSFIANNKVNARAIGYLTDGRLMVNSEVDNEWYDLHNNSGSVRSKLPQNLDLHSNRGFFQIDDALYVNSEVKLYEVQNEKVIQSFDLPYAYPECIIEGPAGILYLAYRRGYIYSFDTKDKQFRLVSNTADDNGNPTLIYDIALVDNDQLIVGAETGMYLLHLNTSTFEKVIDLSVLALERTKDGTLYVSDLSNNLYKYDHDERSIDSIVTVNAPIATITLDGNQRLWLGTFNGVSVYDQQLKQVENLGLDLLAHPEANRYSSFYDSVANIMYIGSLKGVTAFDLDKYNSKFNKHHLSLTSVTDFDGRDILPNTDLCGDELYQFELSYDKPYIKLNFFLNDPLFSKIKYAYQFDGDNAWTSVNNPGELEFTRLAPGKHKIRIKATDSNNTPSSNMIEAQVYVKDIFYKQWWFLLMSVAILAGLILYWFRRNRIERIRLEKEVAAQTKELREEKEKIELQSEQLKELDVMKNQFFANISHELRTPLTLILSPLEQLTKEQGWSEQQQLYLRLMADNGKLLKERIDEMLELSRLEAHKITLEKQSFSMEALIDFSTRIFIPAAQEKGLSYKISVSNIEGIYAKSDEKRLSKIIQNLIINAIKFTPKGGFVIASFSMDQSNLIITVVDSGIGIPEPHQEKVFQRFYQVNNMQSIANPGAGIGLAMVSEYVHLMKGTITLHSIVNQGTTITVSLPMKTISQVDLESDYIEYEDFQFSFLPLLHQTKSRILIVEDNADLRTYLDTLLSPYFETTLQPNGRLALEYLLSIESQAEVDVIVSDIMMPDMDGLSLLQEVRNNEKLKLIPFIFLTAKHNEADIIQAYKMGVDDYIKKPFSEEGLLHRINAVYHNYKSRVKSHIAFQDKKLESLDSQTATSESIEKLNTIIEREIGNIDFSVESVAEKMEISKRTLTRLVQKEIGVSPGEYIKEYKLNKARQFIERDTSYDLALVATEVGFSDIRYFRKIYFERFGEKV